MLKAAQMRVEALEKYLRRHYLERLEPLQPLDDYEDLVLALDALEKIRVVFDNPFWMEVGEGDLYQKCWEALSFFYHTKLKDTTKSP